VGVVSDEALRLPVPVFPLDDPGPVCEFLEQRFLGGA
jgi:molybdopterin-guanine dinucleotide biosynthesis protein B/molybdopterin-guanine dinucleotide biosynthesis protein